MDANQLPTPDEARASLDTVDQTRRAAFAATQRPAWVNLVRAVVGGVYLGLLSLGGPTARLIGAIFFGATLVCLAVVEQRLERRRGRILDNRAVGASVLRLIPLCVAVGVLAMTEPPANAQPWYSIGVGLAAACGAYLYLRWADGYQTGRLAADNYDRANLQ